MRFPSPFCQFWFGIKQVHLAWATVLHQLNHGFGRCREMSVTCFQVAIEMDLLIGLQQAAQSDCAESKSRYREQFPAGNRFSLKEQFHSGISWLAVDLPDQSTEPLKQLQSPRLTS